MNSPRILEPLSFPLNGTRLIEASAGTGKTYTLAALYVRLVLNHGGDGAFGRTLLPPDILVVTFTEAATAELRDRIRNRLADAARCFRGVDQPAPDDLFLTGLLADYPDEAARLKCADLLDVAAQWMDEAAVYTIHGFSNRMLRQHAFETGSLFNLELSEQDNALLQEAARDYWRTFCYPLDEETAAELSKCYPAPDALLADVRRMMGKCHEEASFFPEDLPAMLRKKKAALSAMKARWADWSEQLVEQFEKAWNDKTLKKSEPGRSADIGCWLKKIHDWTADSDTTKPDLTDAVFKRLSAASMDQLRDRAPELAAHPAFAAIEELRDPAGNFPDPASFIRPHATRWIADRVQGFRENQGLISFDDMLTRLQRALEDEVQGCRLARTIRNQYPVALIDEFQDTDPVQYAIFSTLYATQKNTGWFMIGDPKQAIYGFRGADIHTYLKARRATEGNHFTLGSNFRSAAPLVEAVNHLFGQAEAFDQGAFLIGDGIPFHPVRAAANGKVFEVDGSACEGMTLWHLPPDDPDANSSVSSGKYQQRMAEVTAGHIADLLRKAETGQALMRDPVTDDTRPLRPADIAILVRKGPEADGIRKALSRRNLRSVYLSDRDNVLATAEAHDLLHWLRACAEPGNELLLRSALATESLALSWQVLANLTCDETAWENQLERFHGYQRIWHERGVLPMLRQLLRDFGVAARLLSRNNERSLTNLLHLTELLQAAADSQDGEQALVRWFADAVGSAVAAADEQILRLESDADLIKVVTIHKSKGLEYPLVYLPFVTDWREVAGKDWPVSYHDDEGNLCHVTNPDNEALAKADSERLAEDLRLLYVAVTRARNHCWAGLAAVRKDATRNRCDIHKSAMGYLLNGGDPVAAEAVRERMLALASVEGLRVCDVPVVDNDVFEDRPTVPHQLSARTYRGQPPETWWIASYTALRPDFGETVTVAADSSQQDVIADEVLHRVSEPFVADIHRGVHGFPRGSLAGTFLHGLLEQAALDGFAQSLASDAWPDLIAQRCRRRGWDQWSDVVRDWMCRYLAMPLPLGGDSVTLAALAHHQYLPEMEFLLSAHQVDSVELDRLVSSGLLPEHARPALNVAELNGMLKGFIDLVFESGGRYYVVDYKSNWLGATARAYSEAAMTHGVLEKRQDVQILLYVLALHRLLQARLGKSYDYDRHAGGAALLFLRGMDHAGRGVWFQRPSRSLVESLDKLFRSQELHHAE